MTLTDAGPLIALIDKGDQGHAVTAAALPQVERPLLTTWPCYAEAMYLLGEAGGFTFQQALWRLRNAARLVIHPSGESEVDRMEALMMKFRDPPMDLADASLVAAAEALGLRRIFTLDSHFFAYRTADGKALEVVPRHLSSPSDQKYFLTIPRPCDKVGSRICTLFGRGTAPGHEHFSHTRNPAEPTQDLHPVWRRP